MPDTVPTHIPSIIGWSVDPGFTISHQPLEEEKEALLTDVSAAFPSSSQAEMQTANPPLVPL